MIRRPLFLFSGMVLVTALLGVRAWDWARVPPFEPDIVVRERHEFELQGVSFTRNTPAGVLRIRARRLRPGHQTVGFFKLGPSTFIALEDVVVECTEADGGKWVIRESRARMDARKIRFRKGVTIQREGSPTMRHRRVSVDLTSGRKN